MKLKKLFPVLLAVLFVAAVFVVPAFAQSPEPPVVAPPVFDWAAISNALNTLLSALLLPVIGFAARWFFAQGSYQKSLLSNQEQYALDTAIKVFVYAAEQMKIKGFINDKLTYVTERAEAWLIERNISMDLKELRARIEAAVMQEFPKIAVK
jgi:hypothetical protein